MNLLYFPRIHYELTMNLLSFPRIHYELTIFFGNSLRIHYRFRESTFNTLSDSRNHFLLCEFAYADNRYSEFTINSLSLSRIH